MQEWSCGRSSWALSLLLVCGVSPAASVGPGVVSTASVEVRASISPDGTRIVWGSTNREGGPGGWDLWQARRENDAWIDAQALPINTPAKEFDPAFSADGRWLYFFSDRPGGQGGDDLYRVELSADGGYGRVENLGAEVNTTGDEWAPTPSTDGRELLFASDGRADSRRHDLYFARWDGQRFAKVRPVPGVNSAADEFDATWIAEGRALLFARSDQVDEQPIRLWLAHCDGHAYATAQPWNDPINRSDGYTLGPSLDPRDASSLLVTALQEADGKNSLDIVRVAMPTTRGRSGCTESLPAQRSRSQVATEREK